MKIWDDAERISYLRVVVQYLNGLELLVKAAEVGTLADPYAIPHEIRRARQTVEAVIASFNSEP